MNSTKTAVDSTLGDIAHLDRMLQFFSRMPFEFPRYTYVGRAHEHLAIDRVGNARLIFSGQIFN